MPPPDLAPEEYAEVVRLVRAAIDGERYVLSPRVKRLIVRRQGFRDNGLGKLREALAHRVGEVRQPAAGAASGD